MNPIMDVISGLVKPISDAYTATQERKAAKESAGIKLQQSQLSDAHEMKLTDAEWEALAVAHSDSSWKDEYVTLIITAPIVGLLIGGVWCAFTGSPVILDGMQLGMASLEKSGVNLGNMMTAVVYAAIGLKVWRK